MKSATSTPPGGALLEDNEFLAVNRSLFTDEFLFDFDLYVRGGSGYVLYWAQTASPGVALTTRLMETNFDTVFIRNSDEDGYYKYVEKYLPIVLSDRTRPLEEKAGILSSCSASIMKRAMGDPTNGTRLHMAGVLAQHLVDQILSNRDMFSKLVTLTSHHYYTYTHSVDVCIFSVALAQYLGSFDKAQLSALGLGAMLHDLGKSKINRRILDRNGPLSQDEWAIVKQHPRWSCDMVEACYALPETSRLAILQHHERCDGNGYPAGLERDSIDTMAKVVMIADVYSALTTRRAYKDASVPIAAATTMVVEMAGFFESAMLKKFIRLLGDMETPR